MSLLKIPLRITTRRSISSRVKITVILSESFMLMDKTGDCPTKEHGNSNDKEQVRDEFVGFWVTHKKSLC